MTPQQIKELLHASPFEPLRIVMTDGRKIDVPHPEFAMLTDWTLVVNVKGVVVLCPLAHISGVEIRRRRAA
jgi:hypothetical protein